VSTPQETVSPDMAEVEFGRFATAWDLDTDTDTMEEADESEFLNLKRKLCRAIASGALTINDDGNPVYAPRWSSFESLSDLTFTPPKGDAVLKLDKFKEQQLIHRVNSYMGSMCGLPAQTFGKMSEKDLKICRAIVQLFLGS